jgi:hypothetical protein
VSIAKQRPQMDYVPQESADQARTSLDHYQRAREILEQICEINRLNSISGAYSLRLDDKL